MKTAKAVLDIARGEIGTVESPPNSNRQKYGQGYGWNGVAWCAIFVWWCFNAVGAADLLPVKTASCWALMDAAKKAGTWVTSGFQPGDVLIYNFGTSKNPQYHTGILESVSGGVYTAIEGNTASGNDANGGRVMRRTRKVSLVEGAVRPKYDADAKPLPLIAQEILDGKWGNGDARREKLTAAGYDPAEVQKLVNALCGQGIRFQVTVKPSSTLSLRAQPNVNSVKLGDFQNGAMVRVTEVREGPGASLWGRTSTGIMVGWIALDYVREV